MSWYLIEPMYGMECHHCGEKLYSIFPTLLLAMMDDHLELEFEENTKKNSVV